MGLHHILTKTRHTARIVETNTNEIPVAPKTSANSPPTSVYIVVEDRGTSGDMLPIALVPALTANMTGRWMFSWVRKDVGEVRTCDAENNKTEYDL